MIKHDAVRLSHFERYTPLATTVFFVLFWIYWVYRVGFEVWQSFPVFVFGWTFAHYSLLTLLALDQCRQRKWNLSSWLYACRWEIIFFYWVVPAIVVQAVLVAWGFDWAFDYYHQKSDNNYKPSFPAFAITLPLWPLFLLLWYIRDINRAADIRQAHMNHLQADFHQLQEWVTTSEKTALRVSAIYQLKRFYTGEVLDGVTDHFEKPVLELFNVLLTEIEDGESEPANEAIKRAIESAISGTGSNLRGSEAHQKLGKVYENLGKQEAALEEQKKALAIDPKNADAFLSIGNLWRNQGNISDALAAYERAIEIKPDGIEALNNLGALLGELGRKEEAKEAFLKSIEQWPHGFAGPFNMACLLSGEKPQCALNWLRKALERNTQRVLELAETDTDLDPLRDLPEYSALIEEFKGRGSDPPS